MKYLLFSLCALTLLTNCSKDKTRAMVELGNMYASLGGKD
jgi:hypothetical protein